MTVSPAITRSPAVTSRSHSGGTKTSIRDPNFIRPIRWPVAISSPTDTRVTTRRAIRPTIRLLADPTRHGYDRLADLADAGGPVIFAANHHSHIDTPLLLSVIPEPWQHHLAIGAAAATGWALGVALVPLVLRGGLHEQLKDR